jgi:MoxR-like ATPase
MSALNFGTSVSLAEAATLIINCPNNRFFLQGEPGIGKSSIMGTLERHFGDTFAYAYFDCAQADLGDIAMPSVNRDKQITEYFANAIFQLQTGKPVIIMLDEFTKAPQPVQNMLHPMLEARNPRLGNIALPAGSMVFMTGNMSGEGLGDTVKPHTRNRVTTVNGSQA